MLIERAVGGASRREAEETAMTAASWGPIFDRLVLLQFVAMMMMMMRSLVCVCVVVREVVGLLDGGGVAVVVGASRGLGRGIAVELGKAHGYTVYCCGRSSRGGELTVERTAELVTQSGGLGIAVRVDARDEASLRALAERVRKEQGFVDCLAYAAYETPDSDPATFRDPFWKQPATMWDTCHGIGLKSAYSTLAAFAEQLTSRGDRRPAVALVSSFGGASYTFNLAYGVGKAAVDRLAKDAAVELGQKGVDVLSLYPGVVRTETNLDLREKGKWDAASGGLDLDKGESPAFTGRALAELMKRPRYRKDHSGSVQVVAELAAKFDFDDPDPAFYRRPPSIRSLKFLVPNFLLTDDKIQQDFTPLQRPIVTWLRDNAVPDYLLPWDVFSAGPPPPQPQPQPQPQEDI